MPSPSCRIPITIVPSDFLIPMDGVQGCAYIPTSILPGESITLEGFIKARLRRPLGQLRSGTSFLEQHTVSVRAIMPWLNRTLPRFEFSKTVEIQYPIVLQEFDFLKCVAQGSRSTLKWKVR